MNKKANHHVTHVVSMMCPSHSPGRDGRRVLLNPSEIHIEGNLQHNRYD